MNVGCGLNRTIMEKVLRRRVSLIICPTIVRRFKRTLLNVFNAIMVPPLPSNEGYLTEFLVLGARRATLTSASPSPLA